MAKILITDDSAFMRELIKDFIQEFGHDIYFAGSGDELLESYGEVRPDAVVLDIVLPGKDGVQTLRELKANFPDAKVIMCSALVEQKKFGDEALEAGAVVCIKKPFSGNELMGAIDKCLNG